MTGAAEFSVYVLQDDVLKLAFQPTDEHRPIADVVVASDDPLFAAIVTERRLLSAASSDDAALLGQRGILAGTAHRQSCARARHRNARHRRGIAR